MANFKVVLPTTTEEWQRDMNIAYNQALEDFEKFILNSCNNVACREDINADNDFDFYASELLDMLKELKKYREITAFISSKPIEDIVLETRNDAIDECIKIAEETVYRDTDMLVEYLKELKK